MTQGDRPDLLITHGPSCLDGWACIWALHQRWPDVPVHIGVYGQPAPDVTGLRVLIADFSYPEDVLRAMAEVAKEVIVLDHHASSAESVTKLIHEGIIRGEHDQTRSGASLTWTYVWGIQTLPRLIVHVQDRDLWKFEVEGTREVTAVLASYGYDRAQWTEIARMIESGRHREVWAQGEAIERARRQDMAAVIRAGRREMVIGGELVPVVNAPFFWASEIGNILAEAQPFAATYMDLEDGRRQFSLRSRGGLDVSKVAEGYGGGGHAAAAGFTAAPGWEGDESPVQVIPLASKAGKVRVDG